MIDDCEANFYNSGIDVMMKWCEVVIGGCKHVFYMHASTVPLPMDKKMIQMKE